MNVVDLRELALKKVKITGNVRWNRNIRSY